MITFKETRNQTDHIIMYNVFHCSTCEVSSGTSICAVDNKNVCLGSSKIQHIRVLKKGEAGTVKEEKNFTGHTSNTNQLLPIPHIAASCYYFLSSAEDDRFIYAWWVLRTVKMVKMDG